MSFKHDNAIVSDRIDLLQKAGLAVSFARSVLKEGLFLYCYFMSLNEYKASSLLLA